MLVARLIFSAVRPLVAQLVRTSRPPARRIGRCSLNRHRATWAAPMLLLGLLGPFGTLSAQTTTSSGTSGTASPHFGGGCLIGDHTTVSPCGGSASALTNATSQTVTFTVKNTDTAGESYDLSCGYTAPVTSCVTTSFIDFPNGSGSHSINVTYSTGATPGTGKITLTATSEFTGDQASGSFNVAVNTPALIAVTPDGSTLDLRPTSSYSQSFTLSNPGSASGTFNLTATCSGTGIAGCTPSATSVTIGSGAATTVTVSYQTLAAGTSGKVELLAVYSSNSATKDSGWVDLNVRQLAAPIVVLDSVNPGPVIARDQCIVASAGAGAAYECGDLRLAYALPPATSLGTAHTPVLVYSSQQAHPYPVIGANVGQGSTSAVPDSVTATLTINGAVRARGTWAGSDWGINTVRRIALGYDALADSTGLYAYSLQTINWYGATQYPVTSNGQLAIVNRAGSHFGAGWWLAGLEQLYPGSMLWIGGDGSVRQYAAVRTNVWAAPQLDHPDTLKKVYDATVGDTVYVRYDSHGVQVEFDRTGNHIATINRLGFRTTFAYTGGEITSISLPPSGSGPAYGFLYDGSGHLFEVNLPPATNTERAGTVGLTSSAGCVIQIYVTASATLADTVRLSCDTGFPNRIVSRTSERGARTTFAYDRGDRLSSASLDMGAGQSAIAVGFAAAESKGLASGGAPGTAVDTALAYTAIDGPRTDVADSAFFWLDRYGAPRRIKDALGAQVVLTRGDARWPTLVTKEQSSYHHVVTATYDGRGNLASTTDSSRSRNGVYATMRYEWDPAWDFVTKVVPPLGDSLTFGYDASNGNRLWQRNAHGDTVRFRYADSHGFHLLTSIKTPLATLPASDPVRDSMTYDALGNLYQRVMPNGLGTGWITNTYYRDLLGRDTGTVIHVGNSRDGDSTLVRHVAYDGLGRVTLEWSKDKGGTTGPDFILGSAGFGASGFTWYADELQIERTYDAEGHILTLERTTGSSITPPLTTQWRYDNAGRVVKEIAPDRAADSTVYDPAGNRVRWITRRGDTLSYTYDALNRLTQRVLPSVTYAAQGPHPKYPNDGANYTVGADTALFTYDSVGHLLTANNGDARVTRVYNADGTLATDQLAIRVYTKTWMTGTDFSKHVYQLRYSYDLDGRRTAMHHPAVLLQGGNGNLPAGWSDSTRYVYNSIGAVDSIVDPMGHIFRFTYDREERPDSTLYPNHTWVSRSYNGNGFLARLREATDAALPDSVGFDDKLIRDIGFEYDDAGQVVQAVDRMALWRTWYNGLGAVTSNDSQYCKVNIYTDSAYVVLNPYCDPAGYYGNQYWVKTLDEWFAVDGLGNAGASYSAATGENVASQTAHYYDGAGRMTSDSILSYGKWVGWPYQYDAAGSMVSTGRQRSYNYCSGAIVGYCPMYERRIYAEDRANYYAADNQLKVTDRATNDSTYFTTGGFEEYRYDALGRRVLRRYRSDCELQGSCGSTSQYDGFVERTVYDGDQVLYEIRSPGGKYATDDSMEVDNLDQAFPGINGEARYARVVYTHGPGGIDRALAVTRLGWIRSNNESGWANVTVFLHPDWRGEYTQGTDSLGHHDFCEWISGSKQPGMCIAPDFKAQEIATYTDRPIDDRQQYWYGSLLKTKMDMSGQVYMRNRYFDAQSGRFLQEDPIGLAGGMNLYALGGSNPVSYSDPFGLCPYGQAKRDDKTADCPKDEIGNALRWLDKYGGKAGRATIEGIRDKELNPLLVDQTVMNMAAGPQPEGGIIDGLYSPDHPHLFLIVRGHDVSRTAFAINHEVGHASGGKYGGWAANVDLWWSLPQSLRLTTNGYLLYVIRAKQDGDNFFKAAVDGLEP